MAAPASEDSRALEREFVAHREAVLGMLRVQFSGVGDHEDLYQEAWAEAIERQARGEVINNFRALLKVIAWRRACDLYRKRVPVPTEAAQELLEQVADPEPLPDEVMDSRVDAAVIKRIVAEVGPREAAIVKLRFDLGLTTKEITEVLGISQKRLDKTVTKLYRHVLEELTADASGVKPWTRKQRSLLIACLADIASPAQRARARVLLAEDPSCRAMLAELRTTMDRVAAALPLPVFAETQREHAVAALDQVGQTIGSLRDSVTVVLPRVAGQPLTEPVTGSVATLGTAGAAKVVVICLSLGGGTAACIEAGVFGREQPVVEAAAPEPRKQSIKDEQTPRIQPKPTPTPVPQRRKRAISTGTATASTPQQPTPKVNGPAAPSPVAPGTVEFGPGTQGSSSPPPQPAAAPVEGGGEFAP